MAASENPPSDNPESESTDSNFSHRSSSPDANKGMMPEDFSSLIEQVVNEPEKDIWQTDTQSETPLETPIQVRPPGPGLIESIGWMIGVFVAHFLGGLVFIIAVFAYLISTGQLAKSPSEISDQVDLFLKENLFEVAGVEQGVFVLIVIAAVGLRLGRKTSSKLNLQPFALSTGFILFLCVLPLSMISGELYRIAFDVWSVFAEKIPILKQFDQLQTMEVVKQMAESSPLWSLVFVIAVLPAIGEELVFRGVIGRGLLARWGLIPAILITSVMFGLVHVHPAHVIAVIPLGMFMHYVYYVTRSFWAPVLVHFMNNAFAVTVSKMALEYPEQAAKLGDETQAVHPLITLAAGLFIAVVCCYLWKTRAKYLNSNSSEWTPGYLSNESPPPGEPITFEREKAPIELLASLAISFIMFWVMQFAFGQPEITEDELPGESEVTITIPSNIPAQHVSQIRSVRWDNCDHLPICRIGLYQNTSFFPRLTSDWEA